MNEAFHPVQVEGFRRMTPAQKLRMVVRDVRFMLAASDVDRAFVAMEAGRLGLHAHWRRCQTEPG